MKQKKEKINNARALDEELKRLFDELKTLDTDSDEYRTVLNRIDTLYKIRNDDSKTKRESGTKIVTDSVSTVLPLIFYGHLCNKGFKFEETGAISSSTFRHIWGNVSKIFKK